MTFTHAELYLYNKIDDRMSARGHLFAREVDRYTPNTSGYQLVCERVEYKMGRIQVTLYRAGRLAGYHYIDIEDFFGDNLTQYVKENYESK